MNSVAFLLSGVIGLNQSHIPWGMGSNPTGDMAGLRTLVKPLIIIFIQLSGCNLEVNILKKGHGITLYIFS